MKISQNTILILVLGTLTKPLFAFTSISEDLAATASATDIALFKCSYRAGITGINRIRSIVRDFNPPNATPNLKVQIANATSATTCPDSSSTSWSAAQMTNQESTWSQPVILSSGVSQTPPQNYFCVKITKSGLPAETYTLDQGCYIAPAPHLVVPTILVRKIVDQ